MTTMTLDPVRRTTRPLHLAIGTLAGVALAGAGVWNALIQTHVTVSGPPPRDPQLTAEQGMQVYYTWFADTAGQQRADTILALVGVLGVVVLVVELRRRTAEPLGRIAGTAVQVGGLVWGIGALVAVGGHRAVALMGTHGNPIQTVNAIAFTTDVTSDAFCAAAFVLLGGGLLTLSATALPDRTWRYLSIATGLLSLVVAYGYVASVDSITTYELGALAAVLLPAWLVATGRNLDHSTPAA